MMEGAMAATTDSAALTDSLSGDDGTHGRRGLHWRRCYRKSPLDKIHPAHTTTDLARPNSSRSKPTWPDMNKPSLVQSDPVLVRPNQFQFDSAQEDGVGVQFLCSYITLPLYALVSQMGSSMKKTIFNEQTSKVLRKWHQAAKKRHQKGLSRSTSQSPGLSPLSTPNASAIHPLGRFRSRGPSDRSSSSPRRSYSDIEISDAEVDMQKFRSTVDAMPMEHELPVELQHVDGGFSFAKPPPIRTRQNL